MVQVNYNLFKYEPGGYPLDKEESGDNVIYHQFDQIAKEVSVDMDENKTFEKILDRIDQDRRDQEQRLSKNMELMEQRITEERRLSEERMEKSFKEAMESMKNTNHKIESLENKLDEKTEKMLEKVDSTNKWMIGTCIATILAVAAIAASVWFK